jgi:hypothetical protein
MNIKKTENRTSVKIWDLHELLLTYDVIQQDETPVEVMNDGRPANSKSFMWIYRSDFWILMKKLDRNSFHWSDTPDELQKVTLKEMHWLRDGLSLNPEGAFKECHPKIIV